MKKAVLILVVLLPLFAFAQTKKDNLIIVTPTSQDNIFKNTINTLSENGYIFSFTDGDLEYAVTGPVEFKGGHLITYIDVTEEKIILNALLYMNDINLIGKVKMVGASNSVKMNAWEELNYLAKLLGTCEYKKVGND